MKDVRQYFAVVTTALIFAAVGDGAPQQTGTQQPAVGKAQSQSTPFLDRDEYPDRIGHAVWDVFAKHQFADSFSPANHRFATPWIVLRGPDASFWYLADRFHSDHAFDRIYVQVTQDHHVTVSITPHAWVASAWTSLGRAFADRRPEAELIATEIAGKLGDGRDGKR